MLMSSVLHRCSTCHRLLNPLTYRRFQVFPYVNSSLNVSKLLGDIQKSQKQNSKRKGKQRVESTGRSHEKQPQTGSLPVKSSKEDGAQNLVGRLASANAITMEQSENIFQTECDVSVDIFQELGLDNIENSFESKYLPSSGYGVDEEYEIYDDAFMTKKNLLSYIHVCIYHDQLAEAHAFLLEFVGKFSSSLSSSDIASCCELLIKGWARKGNTENVLDLMNFIKNTLKIRPTTQIYEYCLLAHAKQIKEATFDDIQYMLADMKKFNLSPDYLLYKPNLNKSEVHMVKNLLDKYDISGTLKRFSYPKRYNNKLVEKIFEDEQQYYDPFEGIDLKEIDRFVEEQFESEINSVVKVKPIDARFQDLIKLDRTEEFFKRLIHQLEDDWRNTLTRAFQAYLKSLKSKHKRLSGIPFIHYMTILEPEFYVETMLEEIRKCASFSENYSPFAAHLFESLGRKIMSQYLLRSNLNDGTFQDFKECYKQYVKYTLDPELMMKYNPREYWQHLLENGHHYYFDDSKYWPNNVLKEIGKDLYEIISTEAKFNLDILKMSDMEPFVIQPVLSFFYKNHETYKTKKEIRVNPLLIKIYEGASSDIHFEAERMPMLSPPVPWVNSTFGGNLFVRNFIVRLPLYYPKHRLKKLPIQQLYPTLDSLNALSLCPWIINEKILDLAIEVFKNKGDPNLDIPVSLSYFGPLPRASFEMTSKERAIIYHKRKMQKKEQAEMYSLWVDCLYKLSIGNHLRNRYFWFPINTDFRSRVYPIPPNFNHLGSDLSRALLLFAKGKPLGEKGLQWLKIHLINLTGLKKRCSAMERLQYADEILDLIMDSADNPLTGQKWWMESDEKWQTLACCIELTNAIRSGDPHSYVSHIPVHQDGSCNGLQHYAALGRDVLGAKSVNLSPAEYPQDVYSDVAALVEAEIEKDSEMGLEIAKVVRGFISRKIVKQTVMTYVYGVTRYGAKLQVLKRLKEDSNFPEAHKVTASLYISEKIFLSIRKMFTQTRVIQDWLTNCAQIFSNEYGETVEWVTPLGFPVIQSYYKAPKKSSQMNLTPNTMKQKNAFPANFIHSLDSSHMMLTSLQCQHHGLTFASVHDCYWTHASHIDQMNYFCRKQFVALHSEPILDNLSDFLRDKLEQYNQVAKVSLHSHFLKEVNCQIPKGDFDLNSVMDSVYFFS